MAEDQRMELLERLGRLRAEGVLSESEFETEKRAVLAGTASTIAPHRAAKGSGALSNLPFAAALAALLAIIAAGLFWIFFRAERGAPVAATAASVPAGAATARLTAPTTNGAAPAPPAAAPARPESPSAPPLGAYADKYPFDRVEGVTFLDHPAVRAAVGRAVAARTIRRLVLTGGTAGPIDSNGRALLSWACEPHNCGPHNWTVIIARDGSAAQVCHYNEAAADPGPHWHPAPPPGPVPTAPDVGGCPQEF